MIPSMQACFDELEKIAQEAPVPVPPEKKKTSLKRWMANTAIIGGSVAAGTAIGMITDKVISNLAGPKWQSMSQNGRSAVLMPAMAAAGIGTMVLGQKILREREEADRA